MPQNNGKVFLIGAGPGDVGLFTLKGAEALGRADVVIYDFLANPKLLAMTRPDAEVIYVGKQGGQHTMAQEQINRLIVDKAAAGLMVARLKGGDPFIFGRGGEEAEELVAAGLEFEVIPGVTSAISVPAYAGIPLTHRRYASSVAIITGHEDPTKDQTSINWAGLATGVDTLVFLMGMGHLAEIAAKLIENGRTPGTPVALIRRGTSPSQQTVTGTLSDIAARAEDAGLKPPAIIGVGEVVKLRESLTWYEKLPLFGRRIVVTRSREQASSFVAGLNLAGADCIEFPTISIGPPDDWALADKAIGLIENYDWIVFTSVNGVFRFFDRLAEQGRDVRDLKGIKLCAIGPATAAELTKMRLKPDVVPPEYRAEAVVTALKSYPLAGSRILIPRALEAREVLPEELSAAGAQVTVVPVYQTVKPSRDTSDEMKKRLLAGEVDMVTFTSSSTVTNFVDCFDPRDWPTLMTGVTVAAIGPITAKTAAKHGLIVRISPLDYTIPALIKAIIEHYSR
ncbi:MAG: uroporphyrinogen-III C-methyltransferase [Deltaproteobacteria bacterium]|nr:uroporphyrinogen-III C-methyltransferase [Deltaproteobacteria bacterium]